MTDQEQEMISIDRKAVATQITKWLLAAVAGAVLSWVGFTQQLRIENAELEANNAQLQAELAAAALARVEALRTQEQAHTEELEALNVEIANLRTELRVVQLKMETANTLTPASVIRTHLDRIPAPSWCKQVHEENGEVVFLMDHVNALYTAQFGMTRDHYRGKTDLEAGHPEAQAREFYENDFLVYENKASLITRETVVDRNGVAQSLPYWKYYVPTAFGDEFICGSQLVEVPRV